jgi:phosphoenolpyruvate carboxykinase (GTP)
MQLRDGEVSGLETPVGILPTEDELNTVGLEIDPADLDRLLSIDADRWKQEIGFRQAHLEQFANLPDEIWAAHRRVTEALKTLGD